MKNNIGIQVTDPNAQVTVIRPTPQHDRLKQVRERSQAIHEFFLEFLQEKGIELAVREENCGRDPLLLPCSKRIEDLVAEFFEIDLNELENEKRRMLQDIRVENARREIEAELPVTKGKS